MKLKIKTVTKIPEGYIGLNVKAANSHHIKFPFSKNTIEIKRGLTKNLRKRTIRHERIELKLMKHGLNYHKAHQIALRKEWIKYAR